MNQKLIITLLCDDKPGIIESIANIVTLHDGNWLESQLSQLGGKFAGIILVQVHEDKQQHLVEKLQALTKFGIQISTDNADTQLFESNGSKKANFSAAGPDRAGIVKELSQAFSALAINVEKMNTEFTSMPYSGNPLFKASGIICIPNDLNIQLLEDELDEVANKLALDINLSI